MKRVLRIAGISVAVLLGVVAVFYLYADSHLKTAMAKTYSIPDFSISSEVSTADLALGERIVRSRTGCAECHGADLSGHTIIDVPPFAKISCPNLTPYALAGKSDKELAMALRHGLRKDGTSIIFMPSYEYQNLSKSDVAAIIAYLRTIPSVEKANIPIKIGPIGKMLYALGKLPVLTPAAMINHEGGFVPKPKEGPTEEFGKYLVHSACIGCHRKTLTGGPIVGGAPDWPPASNIRFKGRTGWTKETFFKTMQTGFSATSGKGLRLPMAEAVGKFNSMELTAVWLYLSSLEQIET
ncbi:MAG: c-type cytochrome [Acidiferrobacterales bacterium]